jgi:hypothetical protein
VALRPSSFVSGLLRTNCLFLRLGPEFLNIVPDYSTGAMVVQRVLPNGAGERVGLRAGESDCRREWDPVPSWRGRAGWLSATANFEPGHPILLEVEREGEPIRTTHAQK